METAKDLEQAIERYEGYIKVDSRNPLLWLNLGDLYHQAARFDQAIACYERCLLHKPGHAPARSRLASVMISLHRFDQAEKLLK
ncbi:MAG TPA: tetratricopeptide repeat protein, partial [Acidiferrobacterales bacterium]|nr:tetratricopeptide repeat protein [Acidiferrobacterales bacterium]